MLSEITYWRKKDMKDLRLKKLLYLFVTVLFLGAMLTGCAGFKRLFSPARDQYKRAVKAYDNGAYTEAFVTMAEALQEDPELPGAKEFFKDNFDKGIAELEKRLDKKGSQSEVEFAEKKFDTYVNLQDIYSAVEKLPLPFKHKRGKWEWTTEIKDYSAQIDNTRSEAYALLFEHGKKVLFKGDVGKADTELSRAYNKYRLDGTKEKKKAAQDISALFTEYAGTLHESDSIETVEGGIEAYTIALSYEKDNKAAKDGRNVLKKQASVLYVAEGKRLEAKGDLESLEKAIAAYEKALEWDKTNAEAKTLSDQIKPKLAEQYYQKGKKHAQTAGKEAREAALAAFKAAQKWVAGYKDTDKQICIVLLSGELEKLSGNIKVSRDEMGELRGRLEAISKTTAEGISAIDTVINVSNDVTELNNTLKTTYKVLFALNAVPYVNAVTSPTSTMVKTIQRPLDPVAVKVAKITSKTVVPMKKKLVSFKEIVDATVDKFSSADDTLKFADMFVVKFRGCVAASNNKALYDTVESETKKINGEHKKVNGSLKDINDSIDGFEAAVASMSDISDAIAPVKDGIDMVTPYTDKVSGVAREIDKVLNKKITINLYFKEYSFSVNDILDGIGGILDEAMNLLMNEAKKLLNPLLNELNISIPQVPGLDGLEKEVEKLKAEYDALAAQADTLQQKADEFASYQQKLDNSLNALWNEAGCR